MTESPVQVLIAGVQKGGTTSLAAYLESHRSLVGHPIPELPYFVESDAFDAGWDRAVRQFYGRRPVADDQLRLAKSVGVCFVPGCVERARLHNPDMRLILILREPVARAFSAYRYFVARGLEPSRSFAEAVSLDDVRSAAALESFRAGSYVARGLYAEQLRRMFEQFDRSQVLVLVLEEFACDPVSGLQAVAEWLGIEPFPADELARVVSDRYNEAESVGHAMLRLERVPTRVRRMLPAGARPLIRRVVTRVRTTQHLLLDPSTRAALQERFSLPNDDLFDLLGRRIEAWEST